MGKRTPLYEEHQADDAKLVDFAGWDMPVNYGSQIEEHRTVRETAGMFDVSHMAPVDIHGPQARDYLRHLWANDIAKIDEAGRALYTCMLNTSGGIVDDLIVYHVEEGFYRTILNAGTTDKDLAWMQEQAAGFDVTVQHRDDLAIIAVQGPQARAKTESALPETLAQRAADIKSFRCVFSNDWLVGRTGYTGEDGYECIVPASEALGIWQSLKNTGVSPAGLGARDTLRLEAGLNLYGQDMDEQVSPLACGLGWTVAFKPEDRDFIGRQALEAERDNPEYEMVGLVLEARGVMRHGQTLQHPEAAGEGEVTSGSFAPTIGASVGLARVPRGWSKAGETVEVVMRGRTQPARIVKYPFVRNGEINADIQSAH